jgi:hypothetical protein
MNENMQRINSTGSGREAFVEPAGTTLAGIVILLLLNDGGDEADVGGEEVTREMFLFDAGGDRQAPANKDSV